jgi:hypothetical protein
VGLKLPASIRVKRGHEDFFSLATDVAAQRDEIQD